ncbi:hypothetical protein ACCD10_25435 [Pseudomonas sp. Pseusp122]|uniref:hypothetical protein n=1 Tax=unclassified Pseudomonas TaxID=196821 RepID=UPI0039A73792
MGSHAQQDIGGLIFFGNPMEAIPRRLIASEHLKNDDKIGWMLIKLLSHQHRVTNIDASEQLASLLAGTPTKDFEQVTNMILRLRLSRWLVQCGQGSEGQRIYGLYDESATVQQVLDVDPNYPELVAEAVRHPDTEIRSLAQATLVNLLPELRGTRG